MPDLMPYKKMYRALQKGQGEQYASYLRAYNKGSDLFITICESEKTSRLPKNSLERKGIVELMLEMDTLGKCFEETDKAVERTAIL